MIGTIFSAICGAIIVYSQMNWLGKAKVISNVTSENWPLESGIRRYFLDNFEEYEHVAQQYETDPTVENILVLESKLCVNRLNGQMCEELIDPSLRDSVLKAAGGRSFRISENRGVLFLIGGDLKNNRDIIIAVVKNFDQGASAPACSEGDLNREFGKCDIYLTGEWSINYEWYTWDSPALSEDMR